MNTPSVRRPALPVPVSIAAPLASAFLGLLGTASVAAQTQSLAFTGGVLFNPRIELRNLGYLPVSAAAGPAAGSAIGRTYADGFHRVDASGNAGGSTAHWGYERADQVDGTDLVMRAPGGAGSANIDDAADIIHPSANLEYRGSLGSLGESDWGLVLSIGYQHVSADVGATFFTTASTLEDRYSLLGLAPADLPPPPYAGSETAPAGSPRIGSTPSRRFVPVAGGRVLSGTWDFEAELIPISGGLYLESQLIGRLNGIASAGVFVAFVNADLRYTESSSIGGAAPTVTRGNEGGNDVIYGGFVQLGLDWALWENASLTAAARWQPSQEYNHSVNGREARLDFVTAAALHFGFSLRF